MTTHDQPRSKFSIAIGGLGISLECNDAVLTNKLRQQYKLFLSNNPAHLAIQIISSSEHKHSSAQSPTLLFNGHDTCVNAPGYAGQINIQKRHGQLSLSTTQPAQDIDYFVRVAFALLSFDAGGILFHAAGIIRHGQGYLFFGHSGSGKTTIARLSPNDLILNDDLVLLIPSRHTPKPTWQIHATPFWNPTQVNPSGPAHAPLAALFRLVQDQQVYLEEMRPGLALAEIVSNVPVVSAAHAYTAILLKRCQELLQTLPTYRLHFLPDASFWNAVETSHVLHR